MDRLQATTLMAQPDLFDHQAGPALYPYARPDTRLPVASRAKIGRVLDECRL
jgi:hypothetical protein